MSDSPIDGDRWDVTKAIVLTSFSLMMVVTLSPIVIACVLFLYGDPIPELLEKLVMLGVGFVFGTLANMVKDFVTRS